MPQGQLDVALTVRLRDQPHGKPSKHYAQRISDICPPSARFLAVSYFDAPDRRRKYALAVLWTAPQLIAHN